MLKYRRKGKDRGETVSQDANGFGSSASSTDRRAQCFLEGELIRNEIDEAIHNKDKNLESFISHKSMKQIWTGRLIPFFQILQPGYDSSAIFFAEKNLIRILCILVYIRWPHWSAFWDLFFDSKDSSDRHNHLDNSLPYLFSTLTAVSFLGEWASEFFRVQYIFVPIMVESGQIQAFDAERRLPFINKEREMIGEGGFGKVTKEVIASHQFTQFGLVNDDDYVVARKSFTVRRNFRKETKILATLHSSLSRHERIVSYLAIITVGNEFNILSPLADTDLRIFLYEDQAKFPSSTITDLLEESANLSSGIAFLHAGLQVSGQSVFCCHMDLKPDNILVYSGAGCSVGKWKISDFGISALKEDTREGAESLTVPEVIDVVTGRTTIRTTIGLGPGIYQAPEVQDLCVIGGRASDIWSFGCILQEVLARSVGGVMLVRELAQQRGKNSDNTWYKDDYFYRGPPGARILNPHVWNWLHGDLLACSDAERDALKRCQALVLEMLRIEPFKRPNAHQVYSRLNNINRVSVNSGTSNLRPTTPMVPQSPDRISEIDEDLYRQESPQWKNKLSSQAVFLEPRNLGENPQSIENSVIQKRDSGSRPATTTPFRPAPHHSIGNYIIPTIHVPAASRTLPTPDGSIGLYRYDHPLDQVDQARKLEDGFSGTQDLFGETSAGSTSPLFHNQMPSNQHPRPYIPESPYAQEQSLQQEISLPQRFPASQRPSAPTIMYGVGYFHRADEPSGMPNRTGAHLSNLPSRPLEQAEGQPTVQSYVTNNTTYNSISSPHPQQLRQPRSCDDYTIGWICALATEITASREMLDEVHIAVDTTGDDDNAYIFGMIGDHNVVIAGLPMGLMGIGSAAVVARDMKRSFRRIRFCLMVGIGGGIPTSTDIRLGDVVVGIPANGHGGVIQWDFGKTMGGEFIRTGFLNAPPTSLLNHVQLLKSDINLTHKISTHLRRFDTDQFRDTFLYQGFENDQLFNREFDHIRDPDVEDPAYDTCKVCNNVGFASLKWRKPRDAADSPQIHYGTILSGNQVVRDAHLRDEWGRKEKGLCFEMEAAGLMQNFPCLVIRGICDYSDSHKNKRWQPYAAAAAAAYGKTLLLQILPRGISYFPLAFQDTPVQQDYHGQYTIEQNIPILIPYLIPQPHYQSAYHQQAYHQPPLLYQYSNTAELSHLSQAGYQSPALRGQYWRPYQPPHTYPLDTRYLSLYQSPLPSNHPLSHQTQDYAAWMVENGRGRENPSINDPLPHNAPRHIEDLLRGMRRLNHWDWSKEHDWISNVMKPQN